MNLNNVSIFKDNILKQTNSVTLKEVINVNQAIVNQDPLFEGKDLIDVEVTIDYTVKGEDVYRIFDEKVPNRAGVISEESRIKFLNLNNFPDGCILKVDKHNKRIVCYIAELKHNPGPKAIDIAKQFFVGYLHCKSLLAAIDLEGKYEVSFEYFIFGYSYKYLTYEKQTIINGRVKAPPGVRLANLPDLKAYMNYKRNRLLFPYTVNFLEEESIRFEFTYKQLEVEEISNDKVKLKHKITI